MISKIEVITNKKVSTENYNWRPSDQKVYFTDISKVKRILSWEPKTSTSIGIKKVIEWIESNKAIFNSKEIT